MTKYLVSVEATTEVEAENKKSAVEATFGGDFKHLYDNGLIDAYPEVNESAFYE